MKCIGVTFRVWREGKHYVSQCAELGTASCGRTEEEALKSIEEATLLHLDSLEDLGERENVLREKSVPVVLCIIIEPDEPGYHAYCPALPGLHVPGDTEQDALLNALRAAVLYLESVQKRGDPWPSDVLLSSSSRRA